MDTIKMEKRMVQLTEKQIREGILKALIKEAEESNMGNSVTMEEYLGTMLFFPSWVHYLHFISSKIGRHESLKKLYDEVDERMDVVVETVMAYQDITYFVDLNSKFFSKDDPPFRYLETMRDFFIKHRAKLFSPEKHSQIISDIDALITPINQAINLLKNMDR